MGDQVKLLGGRFALQIFDGQPQHCKFVFGFGRAVGSFADGTLHLADGAFHLLKAHIVGVGCIFQLLKRSGIDVKTAGVFGKIVQFVDHSLDGIDPDISKGSACRRPHPGEGSADTGRGSGKA